MVWCYGNYSWIYDGCNGQSFFVVKLVKVDEIEFPGINKVMVDALDERSTIDNQRVYRLWILNVVEGIKVFAPTDTSVLLPTIF